MKGKQLTLDEVLKLDYEYVVWVDFNDKIAEEKIGYENCHCLCFKSEQYDCLMMCSKSEDILSGFEICDNIEVYEWVDAYENPMMIFIEDDDSNIIHKLAQEICNLRGIDLTDDNINKIMKEFEEEK